MMMKIDAFENGFESRKSFENAPFLVWTGENGAEKNMRHMLSFSSAFRAFYCGRQANKYEKVRVFD